MLLKLGYKMLLKLVIVAVVSVVAVAYAQPLMEIVDISGVIDSPVDYDEVYVNFGFDPTFSSINECNVSFDKALDASSLVVCRLLDGDGNVVSEGTITLDNNLPQGSQLSLPVSAGLLDTNGVKVLVIGKPETLDLSTYNDDTPQLAVNFKFDPSNKIVTACLVKLDKDLVVGTIVQCQLSDINGNFLAEGTFSIDSLTLADEEIEIQVTPPQPIENVRNFRILVTPPA